MSLFLPQGQFSQTAKHTVRDDGVSLQILAAAQIGMRYHNGPPAIPGSSPAG